MRDTIICEPLRTAVGRFGGQYRALSAQALGAALVRGLLERTGLPPAEVEDLLFAQCYPSMDAPALGRVVALDAGLPIETGGLQIDRRCGSGLQAILYGVMQVASGGSDLVLTGGAESMSNAPFYSTGARWGIKGDGLTFHDALARGRVTAGGIDDEIVPVVVATRKGETVIDRDEHPRADATLASLAALRPILGRQDPDATVTAGNASGQNDGASVCIVTTAQKAEALGLTPYARLVSWALAGVPPRTMGIGPVPAVARALDRAGLAMKDIDLIELNEAFAAQVLACTRSWGFAEGDFDRLNVNGSGISLGHPVGATGGRLLATLLHEMRRRGARYGIETMCIGGGQGLAAIFERAG